MEVSGQSQRCDYVTQDIGVKLIRCIEHSTDQRYFAQQWISGFPILTRGGYIVGTTSC